MAALALLLRFHAGYFRPSESACRCCFRKTSQTADSLRHLEAETGRRVLGSFCPVVGLCVRRPRGGILTVLRSSTSDVGVAEGERLFKKIAFVTLGYSRRDLGKAQTMTKVGRVQVKSISISVPLAPPFLCFHLLSDLPCLSD